MTTGATILSTTLPTVVGMGVISKTTDTMFGKSKRRKAAGTKAQADGRIIHTGKRGGKYIVRKGRRVYI